jgi:hypothetical protein
MTPGLYTVAILDLAGQRSTEKPPKVATNIEWSRKGAGWDCRKVYYVDKQRKRKHIRHLGRAEWDQWQSLYSPEVLKKRAAEWVSVQMERKGVTHDEQSK